MGTFSSQTVLEDLGMFFNTRINFDPFGVSWVEDNVVYSRWPVTSLNEQRIDGRVKNSAPEK